MNNNPFLLPLPDPYEPYNKQKQLVDEQETEFERLCYEYFIFSKDGQKMARILHKQFIVPSHFDPRHENAKTMAIWWDGFKCALRGLIERGLKHDQHIKEGTRR
jgi:hypothetical protein